MVNPTLYCQIRKKHVAALPEEIVRQGTLRLLFEELGYPLSSIVVEKALSEMPHLALSSLKLPKRRADILCFHGAQPLLLIECKAVKIVPDMLRQLIGYNWYLQAQFLALINAEEIQFGWFDSQSQDFRFINRIPTFKELLFQIEERNRP